MVFTREQWYEVWKKYTAGHAHAADMPGWLDDPERPLPEAGEYVLGSFIEKARLPDLLVALAGLDAEESGAHPTWVEHWSEMYPLSMVWCIVWGMHKGAPHFWTQPRRP